ncbi:MAG: pilus assembly protein TadG-related protein [Acetobacteraceae bacterium]
MAIQLALSMTMLVAFAGLGTEAVMLLLRHRQMQSAADSAAFAGATAMAMGNPADFRVEARAVAASAGFISGVSGVILAVNSPPLSGSHAGAAGAVEVVISQRQTVPMLALLTAVPFDVGARAVATAGASGSYCLLELDPANMTGVDIGNGALVTLNRCGLAVNATGPAALSVSGGAQLNARSVSVAGGVSVTNGGQINAGSGIATQQPAVADPYRTTAVPGGSGCKYGAPGNPLTLRYASGVQTLNADGIYCGGLVMGNGANVVMNPGTYIINGGSFSIAGGVRLSGSGVTIVLTGSGSDYASVAMGNGTAVTLSAPPTGATAGLLFLQDRNAPKSGTSSFQGGTQVVLTGALYFPSQTVTYANGTNAASVCTQLVAWHMQFQGGALFNSDCTNTGVKPIGGAPSRLVE